MTNVVYKHRVDLIEYERGWGSRLDSVEYFVTEDEARAFVKKFNSSNTESPVPDWYMIAEYRGITSVNNLEK